MSVNDFQLRLYYWNRKVEPNCNKIMYHICNFEITRRYLSVLRNETAIILHVRKTRQKDAAQKTLYKAAIKSSTIMENFIYIHTYIYILERH